MLHFQDPITFEVLLIWLHYFLSHYTLSSLKFRNDCLLKSQIKVITTPRPEVVDALNVSPWPVPTVVALGVGQWDSHSDSPHPNTDPQSLADRDQLTNLFSDCKKRRCELDNRVSIDWRLFVADMSNSSVIDSAGLHLLTTSNRQCIMRLIWMNYECTITKHHAQYCFIYSLIKHNFI